MMLGNLFVWRMPEVFSSETNTAMYFNFLHFNRGIRIYIMFIFLTCVLLQILYFVL